MGRNRKLNAIYAAALIATAIITGSSSRAVYAQSAPANANSVVLSSEAKIERVEIAANGKERTILKNPNDVIVVPGDRVVFTLNYINKGIVAASGFRATNPMPGPVQFISAAEDWAEVSVDGGTVWGKLSALKVKAKSADGAGEVIRPAAAEDVTHVRWVFNTAINPGAQGSVSYRGVIK